jgi:ABC-type lipoprotein export system ATPase subunit/bifunctional DNA-binding transcriptional regulator/antitoxin component of YhaV-PrlF toxin-antitoxin module
VLVGGKDLLRMSDRDLNRYRRERVGFVWQQSTRNLIPYLNAIDNVILPMTVAGKTHRSRARATELLTLVGLGARLHHRLSELSGGEQQRVAIAVGLANDPPLLLADEPTGEVDTATAALIYDTFRTLTREMGVTTIIVSHDPGVARQVDRVVAIRDGMLATETVRQSVLRTPEWLAENGHAAGGEHHTFEELVVLDKAGRVHIPPEYLEQVQIRGRARLEVTEDGILIRPVEEVAAQPQVVAAEQVTETKKRGGLRGLFGRRPGKQA